MTQLTELTPTEFRQRWPEDARNDVTILDVREPAERDLARLDKTIDIPMQEVPARLAEIDGDLPIVVMCHSGARSRVVAEYLVAQGFGNVFNLTGGIDAWSQEIDPNVPRY